MHELSAAKKIVEMVLAECREGGIRPKRVMLQLGSFTTYKKEPIEFYFDILKKEVEELKDAELDVEEVQARLRCNTCGKVSAVEIPYMLFCPHCDSSDVELIEGKDMRIMEISGEHDVR